MIWYCCVFCMRWFFIRLGRVRCSLGSVSGGMLVGISSILVVGSRRIRWLVVGSLLVCDVFLC